MLLGCGLTTPPFCVSTGEAERHTDLLIDWREELKRLERRGCPICTYALLLLLDSAPSASLLVIRESCSFKDCTEQSTDSFTGREGQSQQCFASSHWVMPFLSSVSEEPRGSSATALMNILWIHSSFCWFHMFLFWYRQVAGMGNSQNLGVFAIKIASKFRFLPSLSSSIHAHAPSQRDFWYLWYGPAMILLWVNLCAWSASRGRESEEQAAREIRHLSPEKLPQLKCSGTRRLRELPKYTCPTPPPIKKAPAALLTVFSYSPPGREVKLNNKLSYSPRPKVLTGYCCRHRAFHTGHTAAQQPRASRTIHWKRQQLLTSGDRVWVIILMCSTIFLLFVWVFLLELGNWCLTVIISILLIMSCQCV